MPRQLLVERPPLVVRARGRVVDVEVGDARRPRARGAAARASRASGPANGSTWSATRRPAARAGSQDERQPRSLGRARAPPRDDHGLDADRCDLAHLRAHDVSRRTTSTAPRAGNQLDAISSGGVVAVLLPVLPGAVVRCGAVPRVVEDRHLPRARRPPGDPGWRVRGIGSARASSAASAITAASDRTTLRNPRETLSGRQCQMEVRGVPHAEDRTSGRHPRRTPWPARSRSYTSRDAQAAARLVFLARARRDDRGREPRGGRRAARRRARDERRPAARRQLRQPAARSATGRPTIRSSIRAAGRLHDHTFLGSKTTDAFSTDASLRRRDDLQAPRRDRGLLGADARLGRPADRAGRRLDLLPARHDRRRQAVPAWLQR